jgi:hypothetical protein
MWWPNATFAGVQHPLLALLEDKPLPVPVACCWCGRAEQGNAVDAFGPEPVRVSDALLGLGATDCYRWAAIISAQSK